MTNFEDRTIRQLIEEVKESITENIGNPDAAHIGFGTDYDPEHTYVMVLNPATLESSMELDYYVKVAFRVTNDGSIDIQGFLINGTSDRLPTKDLDDPTHPVGLN